MLYLIFVVAVAIWICKKMSAIGDKFSAEEQKKDNKRDNMEEFKSLTKQVFSDFNKIKYYLRPVLSAGIYSIRVWVTEQYVSIMMNLPIDESAVKAALGNHITNFDKSKVLEYFSQRKDVNMLEMQTILNRIEIGYTGCFMISPNFDYPSTYNVQEARSWVEDYFRNQGYKVEKKEDGIRVKL